jgi:hypothetical protein
VRQSERERERESERGREREDRRLKCFTSCVSEFTACNMGGEKQERREKGREEEKERGKVYIICFQMVLFHDFKQAFVSICVITTSKRLSSVFV